MLTSIRANKHTTREMGRHHGKLIALLVIMIIIMAVFYMIYRAMHACHQGKGGWICKLWHFSV